MLESSPQRSIPVDLRPVASQIGELRVKIPYAPREVFKRFHRRKERFALTVAHRRAGKTVATVNDDIKRLLSNTRTFPVPQGVFISPTFSQSKRNAWPYAKHYTQDLPGIKAMEGDLTLMLPNGGRYIFAGSDNFDSLRGLYLDVATLDEFGSQNPQVWGQVIRPALSDYGGSATFIGSANGMNHFYDMLQLHEHDPDWLVTILRASETGLLSKEELELAKATMTKEQYAQEFECDFAAAVTGSFYGEDIAQAEKEGRITSVPYDKSLDVYAVMDLGIGGATSVWIYQVVGMEVHVLYHYENVGQALEHYLDWLKGFPFKIDLLFLPHDAKARELLAGITRKEYVEKRGFKVYVLDKDREAEGINAVRVAFPKLWFDAKSCKHGLNCLRMFRRIWDEKRKAFSENPLSDWAAHASDAIRYLVQSLSVIGPKSDWSKPISRGLWTA